MTPLLIGFDVGFGQLKAYTLDGRHLCIPSWTAMIHDRSMATTQLELVNDSGNVWLVGEDAHRLARASVPTVDSGWYEQTEFRVLVRYAMNHFGVQNARIVTGLPIRYMADHRKRMRSVIESWKSDEFGKPLNIKVVKIVAQPAGSLAEVGYREDGTPVDDSYMGRVGVIDIGNGTIDAIEANQGKISLTNHASEPRGVSRAYESVLSYVRSKGIPARIAHMPKAVADGSIRDGKSMLNLEKPIAEAKQALVQAVDDIISDLWTNPQMLDRLVFTGGGAAFAGKELQKRFNRSRVSIPADPHMANVRGYVRLGLAADLQAQAN